MSKPSTSKLTQIQVRLLKMTFDEIDEDGNGVLDRDEMAVLFRKMFPSESEVEIVDMVDEVFILYDTDENGEIDFQEFCDGLAFNIAEVAQEAHKSMAVDTRSRPGRRRIEM